MKILLLKSLIFFPKNNSYILVFRLKRIKENLQIGNQFIFDSSMSQPITPQKYEIASFDSKRTEEQSQKFPFNSVKRRAIHEWLQEEAKSQDQMAKFHELCNQCLECDDRGHREKLLKMLLQEVDQIRNCDRQYRIQKIEERVFQKIHQYIDAQLEKLWNSFSETEEELVSFQKNIQIQFSNIYKGHLDSIVESELECLFSDHEKSIQQTPINELKEQSSLDQTQKKESDDIYYTFNALFEKYSHIQQKSKDLHKMTIVEFRRQKQLQSQNHKKQIAQITQKMYQMQEDSLKMIGIIDEWKEKGKEWLKSELHMSKNLKILEFSNLEQRRVIDSLKKQNSYLRQKNSQKEKPSHRHNYTYHCEVPSFQHERAILQKEISHLKDLISLYKKDTLHVESMRKNNWKEKQSGKKLKNTLKWDIMQFKNELNGLNPSRQMQKLNRSQGGNAYGNRIRQIYGI